MGRYYSGDIEGKWWFGVQPSDVPIRFGGSESHISYEISNDNEFEETMEYLENELAGKIEVFKEFFEQNNGYNTESLMEFFKKKFPSYTESDLTKDLSDYADLEFGNKCKKYFEDSGENYLCISSEL